MTNQDALRAKAGRLAEEKAERLADLLNEYELLICTRDWSAWGHGTMNASDFINAGDDMDLMSELVEKAAEPVTVTREQVKKAAISHYEGDRLDPGRTWKDVPGIYQAHMIAEMGRSFRAAGARIEDDE